MRDLEGAVVSTASKCDKCGRLFEPVKGCITVDVQVVEKQKPDGGVACQQWSEVDLCLGCSGPVLDALGAALQGLRRPKESR